MSAAADPDARAVPSDGHSGPPTGAPAPRRHIVAFATVAALVLVADIVSKIVVVATLSDHEPVRLLGGGVYLVETRNSGAAFSVGTGATVLLTAVALAVVVIILRTARRMRSTAWALALGLVLGGAAGNLVDRMLRGPGPGRGHVVDWISLFAADGHVWPVFNVADSAIVCGAVLAALLAVLGVDLDGTRGAARRARSRPR